MKWSLVYPPFDDKRDRSASYVAPPLGLLSIASYLEAEGDEVVIEDFVLKLKSGEIPSDSRIYDACTERILSTNPDVVGFGTQCSTGPTSINIARRIKKIRPDVAVVLGGHDVSFLGPQYLNAFPFVDAVLGGEAELTAPKLSRALGGSGEWNAVPGLSWRERGQVRWRGGEERVGDLDTLLPFAYHLVDGLETYFRYSQVPTILIDSGRGCAFNCEFCQTTLLNGRKVRYRNVASIIHELRGYRERFGTFEAYFVHDLFTARRAFVEELCEAMIDAELDLPWQCRCRIDEVDEKLLSLMNRARCHRLLYGIESGSEETLARMNKRLRRGVAEETTERVRWTVENGIFPSLSMVVGTPEETLADLEATMNLAARFLQIGSVNSFIQLMSPLPGTALAERLAGRFEYRGDDAPTAFSQGIEFEDGRRLAEDEELVASLPDIFQSFQVVTPDHGDLGLCVDVSLGYCKLLEVYGWSYAGLVERLGTGYLDLFIRFRDHLVEQRRTGRPGLVGIRDAEIWDGFVGFADEILRECDAPTQLWDTFHFERLVHEISVAPPVAPPAEAQPPGPFRLHDAARLFRSTSGLPWEAGRADAGPQAFLLFMSRDRLKIVRLDENLAKAFELLGRLDGWSGAREHHFQRLAQVLAPLWNLGVLQPVTQLATVGA